MADKTLTVKSSDGMTFKMTKSAAALSDVIKNIMEDLPGVEVIPLGNVDGATLGELIPYLNKQAEKGRSVSDKDKLDKELLDGASIPTLLKLVLAANFLLIDSLRDKICQKIADLIMNKSAAWVRKKFGVKNDFTPEEEEEIIRQYQWAHEGVDPDDG